jgi:hypothetical protein
MGIHIGEKGAQEVEEGQPVRAGSRTGAMAANRHRAGAQTGVMAAGLHTAGAQNHGHGGPPEMQKVGRGTPEPTGEGGARSRGPRGTPGGGAAFAMCGGMLGVVMMM